MLQIRPFANTDDPTGIQKHLNFSRLSSQRSPILPPDHEGAAFTTLSTQGDTELIDDAINNDHMI